MAPIPTVGHSGRVIQGSFAGNRPRIIQASRPVPLAASGNALRVPAEALRLGSPGQRLPATVQSKMETLFGTGFSDVRVHVGAEAGAIGAVAFTCGSDLYFSPGRYDPFSPHGQRLLGHELTHVVQQRSGRVRNPFGAGWAIVQDPGMEAEAERMGLRASAVQAKAAGGGVIQRSFDPAFPDDLIVLILHFIGARYSEDPERPADVKALFNFSLTAKRYRAIARDERLALIHGERSAAVRRLTQTIAPAHPSTGHLETALSTYPHALEATRHGAHLHTPRLGFPGTSTVLAVVIDGVLAPWFHEELEDEGSLQAQAARVEEEVKSRITLYCKRYPLAKNVKDFFAREVGGKEGKQLAKAHEDVIAAKRVKPSDILKRALIANVGGLHRQGREAGSWDLFERNKLRYQRTVYQSLFTVTVPLAEYAGLRQADLEYGEEDTYGHSEQLLMMSPRWSALLRNLVFRAQDIVKVVLESGLVPSSAFEVTLLLNRSPCTACASYLVTELEYFWRLLAMNLHRNVAECREMFSSLFIFKIAFSSLYAKLTKDYPHDSIVAALQRAGWHLVQVPELSTQAKQSGTCLQDIKLTPPSAAALESAKRARQEKEEAEEYRPPPPKARKTEQHQQAPVVARASKRLAAKDRKDYRKMGGEDEEEGTP
jgi:hypothetical protein